MTEIEALRNDLTDAVRDRQLLAAEGDKMEKEIDRLTKENKTLGEWGKDGWSKLIDCENGCEREIERLRAALVAVKADLLARADRQDALAEPNYTQHTDADRAMYRHAANMLRLAAEALKEMPQ